MKKYSNFLALFIIISLAVVTLSMYVVASEYARFNGALLGVTTTLFGLYLIWKRKQVKYLLKDRFVRNLISNIITVVLIFCILGMINYLVVKNDWSADFTVSKLNTLSDQSKQVLQQLKSDKLKITLFSKREDWSRYLKLLNLYKNESANIEVNAIDVDVNPTLVQIHGIKDNGTILVEYKGKAYKSIVRDELSVTNLLLRVLRQKVPKIYTIIGHNELSLENETLQGGSFLKNVLKSANYEVAPHDLSYRVPKDAAMILLLNPKTSFLDKELENLNLYASDGGKIVATFSPQFSELLVKGVLDLFQAKGLTFINGLVLDRLSATQGGEASMPIVNSYDTNHSITKKFQGRSVYPISGFFQTEDQSYKWKTIIKTTPFPASWGETDFEEVQSGKANYTEQKDFKGPLPLMVVGENNTSRIVAWSSTTFISNQFQGQANNFNLFLNSLAWVVGEEGLSSLDRPEVKGNLVYISDIHLSMIFYLIVLLFPFVFFGMAIFNYRVKLGR